MRAFGAWIALWAHAKDWRIAIQTGCLKPEAKKPTNLEMELFVKSARGGVLIHEMLETGVMELPEFIVANGVSLAGLLSMTGNDLLRCGVFAPAERDMAGKFFEKIMILMQDDTRRLDTLTMWPGTALNGVDIYILDEDDEAEEAVQPGQDKAGRKRKIKGLKGETELQKVTLTPKGGASGESFMNANPSELAKDWGWGYVVKMEPLPCILTQVRSKMVIKKDCFGFCKVISAANGEEIGASIPVKGMGDDAMWYDFYFGHADEEGNVSEEGVWIPGNFRFYIVTTPPRDALDSNKWVYVLDHQPLRKLNHFCIVSSASFDSRHKPSPASRSVPMEMVIRTKLGVNLDKDPEEIEKELRAREKAVLVSVIDSDVVEEQEKVLGGLWKEREQLMWVEPDEAKKGKMFAAPPQQRDYKRLHELEVEEQRAIEIIRRQLLKHSSKPFEDGLEHMPNKRLAMHVPAATDAAFNFRMGEYWIMHNERINQGTLFHCCDMEGILRRDIAIPVIDVRSFSFDSNGDMFIADSQNHLMKYRPTNPSKSDFFARSWVQEIPNQKFLGGVCASDDFCFGLFMNGTIVKLSKASGSIIDTIIIDFRPSNASGIIHALGRFIIVDSHAVKVVSEDGRHVPVLMGGYEVDETRKGRQVLHQVRQDPLVKGDPWMSRVRP